MQNKQSLEFVMRRVAAFATLLVMLSLLFQTNSVMAHATLVKSDKKTGTPAAFRQWCTGVDVYLSFIAW